MQCSNSSTCSIHSLYGGRGALGEGGGGGEYLFQTADGMYIRVLISSRRELKL